MSEERLRLTMDCLACDGRGFIQTIHASTTPKGQAVHYRECKYCDNSGKRPFQAPG